MSTDIKELVKRLRDSAITLNRPGGILNPSDWVRAADAIEALAGEVERLKEVCKYDALNAGAIAEIRSACKEIMGGNVSFVDDDFARCLFTLKTESDRLKAENDLFYAFCNAAWSVGGLDVDWIRLAFINPLRVYKARKALGDAS